MTDDVPFVSPEAAQTLLARAVALDERRRNALTFAQLREAALEAGIGAEAFEAALAEHHRSVVPRRPASLGGRLWRRLRGEAGNDPRDGWVEAVVANLASFAVFWSLVGLVSRASRSMGLGWEFSQLLLALTVVVSLAAALRLRGRVTALVIGAAGAAAIAQYPMHLLFGIEVVQGGPVKWALMLAGLIGMGFGVWWSRASTQPTAVVTDPVDSRRESPAKGTPRPLATQAS